MTRTLNSPVGDERGEFTYLYEINHSGGTIRITSSSSDLTALSETWTAVGGALIHSSAPDTADRKGQGVQLTLFGVSQTIISLIQNNQFRGRLIRIYLMHFDPDLGLQTAPDLIFQGRQNGDYKITEDRDPDDTTSGGRVTVTTRITADLASINIRQSCRTNVHSHEEFLRRGGVVSPDDKFFERVTTIMNQTIFWGSAAPERARWAAGTIDISHEDDE